MKVSNSTISDTAWGEVDKSALGKRLSDAYAAGDATRSQVEEVYAWVPSDAFEKDSDGNPKFSYSKAWGPHHEVKGGTIVLNRGGVHACAVALAGGRSEPSLSSGAMASAKAHIRGHYKDLDEEPPDSLKVSGRSTGVIEYKILPTFVKSIEGRSVTGIFAVHGNVDSYGDISHPGSFTKTFMERGPQGSRKIMHLWNHNIDMFAGPPVAVVKGLRELGRIDLPQEVLAQAPDATGAAEVVREYLDTPRADEVFKNIEAGTVTEMSYAYDPVQFDFGEVGDNQVRNLREIKLYETSDVLWGANEATMASKLGVLLPSAEVMLKQIERYMEAIKSGARHSSADVKLLNAIHSAVVDLGATNCKGSQDEGDGESQDDKDDAKSRAAIEREIALTLQRADMFLASAFEV